MNISSIADAFLSLESMTHKKLQKLCYYFYVWDIVLSGEENKQLQDTKFEAWIHGPVCPSLYHEYKTHGYEAIPKKEMPSVVEKDEYAKGMILQIFRIYGEASGDQLELLTHSELPWQNARKGLEPFMPSNSTISDSDIYVFYRSILDKEGNE